MSPNRKIRAFMITFIFIISIFSVLLCTSENVAASTTGETTLYFHDQEIKNTNLYSLLYLYIIEEAVGLENTDNLSMGEITQLMSVFKTLNQTKPTKTTDTKTSPDIELKKLINNSIQGNSTYISNLTTGIQESLSAFRAAYLYDQINTTKIKGELNFDLYFESDFWYLWNQDVVNVTFSILQLNASGYAQQENTEEYNISKIINEKITKTRKIEINRINSLKNQGKISSLFKKISKYRLSIPVNNTLEPNDIILIEIDNNPGEKILLDKLSKLGEKTLDKFVNLTESVSKNLSQKNNSFLSAIGNKTLDVIEGNQTIDEIINETKEYGKNLSESNRSIVSKAGEKLLNFSNSIYNIKTGMGALNETINITKVFKRLISSSFVYGSIKHASSVTLPCKLESKEREENENVKKYYLHNKSGMDTTIPSGEGSIEEVNDQEVAKWESPSLDRSKMLEEATASIYIGHRDLWRLFNRDKIKLVATLLSESEEIATSEKELTKNSYISNTLNNPEIIKFSFNLSEPKEIEYGSNLTLKVYPSNETDFGPLGLRRKVQVFYDSNEYPSYLNVKYSDTDHIQFKNVNIFPSDRKLVLGEKALYNITIESEYQDEIKITTDDFSEEEKEYWDIKLPNDLSFSEGEKENVKIEITPKYENGNIDKILETYENAKVLDITFVASGKTGRDKFDTSLELSEDEVRHNIDVNFTPSMKVKHGENGTYHFVIINNNTGLWPANYNVEVVSEHGWAEEEKEGLKKVPYRGKAYVNVTVKVPKYTKIDSDKLTVIVTSEEGTYPAFNATTTVIKANILEEMYHLFDSTAKDLGLKKIAGDYAPHMLVVTVLVAVFFVLIIVAYIFKKKYIKLSCPEKVKKIYPDEKAEFKIYLKNISSYELSYNLKAKEEYGSNKWDISLDKEEINIEPKQKKRVILTVEPTDLVRADDKTTVDVIAKVEGRKETDKISTVTILKDGETNISINGVVHFPKKFEEGDIVKTSFKLSNYGDVASDNVDVILYVNGEEKNKVENIALPKDGYADIEIPWTAVKGKNEIHIVVKESR